MKIEKKKLIIDFIAVILLIGYTIFIGIFIVYTNLNAVTNDIVKIDSDDLLNLKDTFYDGMVIEINGTIDKRFILESSNSTFFALNEFDNKILVNKNNPVDLTQTNFIGRIVQLERVSQNDSIINNLNSPVSIPLLQRDSELNLFSEDILLNVQNNFKGDFNKLTFVLYDGNYLDKTKLVLLIFFSIILYGVLVIVIGRNKIRKIRNSFLKDN